MHELDSSATRAISVATALTVEVVVAQMVIEVVARPLLGEKGMGHMTIVWDVLETMILSERNKCKQNKYQRITKQR